MHQVWLLDRPEPAAQRRVKSVDGRLRSVCDAKMERTGRLNAAPLLSAVAGATARINLWVKLSRLEGAMKGAVQARGKQAVVVRSSESPRENRAGWLAVHVAIKIDDESGKSRLDRT